MNICLIPARGGSKRIPRKNIKTLNGKPIIAYSIEAAFNSNAPILSDTVIPFILPRHLVQDIDTLKDWKRAEIMHEVIKKNREI